MDICKLNEKDCISFLLQTAKKYGEVSPRVVIVSRLQNKNSITRTVRFALVTTANNFKLIDNLILDSLVYSKNLYFVGSELNRQGDLEIDYLFFEANIIAKKD